MATDGMQGFFTASCLEFYGLYPCRSKIFYYSLIYDFFSRIIRFVLDVYCKNPRALDAIREFLVLPNNRLIRFDFTLIFVLC